MPKQKYDWSNLKLEFFKSDCLEVKAFFGNKYHTFTHQMKIKSKWWTKEKKEWLNELEQKALTKAQEKLVEELTIPKEWLLVMKKGVLKRIEEKLSERISNTRELRDIYNIIKTELGEPTSIWKDTLVGDDNNPIQIVINKAKFN